MQQYLKTSVDSTKHIQVVWLKMIEQIDILNDKGSSWQKELYIGLNINKLNYYIDDKSCISSFSSE